MDILNRIDNYRIFYYVVEKGSMNRAAEALGFVPASITKIIQSLEESLHCQLLIRSNKGVILTTEGKALYAWVKPAINLLKSGELEIKSLLSLETGTLNVGIASNLIPNALTGEWLKKFCEKYPHIKINIANISRQRINSCLNSADVDLALGEKADVENIDDFDVFPVFKKHDFAIVGRKYAYLAEHPITIEELAKFPLIFTGDKSSRPWQTYKKRYQEHGLHFEPHILTTIVGMQVNAVRAGLGYSFIPESSYGGPAKFGEISKVQISNMETAEQDFNFYTAKNHPLSGAARAFIDVVTESAPSDLY